MSKRILIKSLARWSKETFSDVLQRIATLEDIIKVKELQVQDQPSHNNREGLNKVEATLRRFLAIEEEYRRQKAGMKWFKERDKNTNLFHSYARGR